MSKLQGGEAADDGVAPRIQIGCGNIHLNDMRGRDDGTAAAGKDAGEHELGEELLVTAGRIRDAGAPAPVVFAGPIRVGLKEWHRPVVLRVHGGPQEDQWGSRSCPAWSLVGGARSSTAATTAR